MSAISPGPTEHRLCHSRSTTTSVLASSCGVPASRDSTTMPGAREPSPRWCSRSGKTKGAKLPPKISRERPRLIRNDVLERVVRRNHRQHVLGVGHHDVERVGILRVDQTLQCAFEVLLV